MILNYKGRQPRIHTSCYISNNASIIGDVTIEQGTTVWFHSVIRGDMDKIFIDENSNVQDGCVLHTDTNYEVHIGKRVTIGHSAVVHGAYIEDEVLIGMGAIVLNGAHIGKHSIIGAGALITEGMNIPAGSVVVGCPGKIIKQISEKAIQDILDNAQHYVTFGQEYKKIDL